MTARRRKAPRSRAVPMAYGITSLVVVVVIATLALVVTPPGPPALAELAPRAEDRIDEALKAQSSNFGSGEGGACAGGQDCADDGGGGAGATTTTAPSGEEDEAAMVDGAAVKRCVGDPPRQTEDPQSPPCVNYWKGDNGGATSKGVTADEIRVAVPDGAAFAIYQSLAKHFNKRYEFYGRKIVLVPVDGDFDTMAVEADEAGAFAVLASFQGEPLDVSAFQEEATRRKIVNILNWTTHTPASAYRAMAPYAWNYAPTADEAQLATADLVCSSLAGRPARYAGPNQRTKTRDFAVLVSRQDRALDLGLLKQSLAGCGVSDLPVYPIRRGDSRETKVNTWLDIQRSGATSLLVFASAHDYTQWAGNYRPADYQPELIVGGMGVHESELQWVGAGQADDRARLLGVWGQNKLVPHADMPSTWARNESGDPPHPIGGAVSDYHPYQALLVLASGIQVAGPRLTPETFAAGLQKARFPNPGADTAPYYQARVGFGPGDFAMSNTFAAGWFSDSAPSYLGGPAATQGGWCYVRRGQRFARGAWPNLADEFRDPDPRNCR